MRARRLRNQIASRAAPLPQAELKLATRGGSRKDLGNVELEPSASWPAVDSDLRRTCESTTMNIRLRLPKTLLSDIHADLSRPHPRAAERVGFLICGSANVNGPALLLLGQAWHIVDDSDYLDDPSVGACIGPGAFRRILQNVYRQPASILHVHRHEHAGRPQFSSTDVRSMHEFVPSFFNACPTRPHGALVLSHDRADGRIWVRSDSMAQPIEQYELIGTPMQRWSRT